MVSEADRHYYIIPGANAEAFSTYHCVIVSIVR